MHLIQKEPSDVSPKQYMKREDVKKCRRGIVLFEFSPHYYRSIDVDPISFENTVHNTP